MAKLSVSTGEEGHGFFLYDETIHVPLMIRMPMVAVRSQVGTPVGLVDIAPTLLQATGEEVPGKMQGKSLLPS
jgi:arylsulfatase A-like enzyme